MHSNQVFSSKDPNVEEVFRILDLLISPKDNGFDFDEKLIQIYSLDKRLNIQGV